MQIGNPNYKTCPHCGAKEEYFPGPYFVNVYELTEWSDGVTFQELPSLEETELQQCYTCNQFYWFTHKGGGLPLEGYLKAAKYFEKEYSRWTIDNYKNRLRNRKRLLYIRIKILRTYNDRIRIHPLSNKDFKKEEIPVEVKKEFLSNTKLLIKLVTNIMPDNYIFLAELYRNIGDFETAKQTLSNLSDNSKKNQLLCEIELKNCEVITFQKAIQATFSY